MTNKKTYLIGGGIIALAVLIVLLCTLVPVAVRKNKLQKMLDATELFNRGEVIKRGDIVDVFGGTLFTADDIAKICGTINYEITSGISQRVARIYIE